jgi:hypothetical protein
MKKTYLATDFLIIVDVYDSKQSAKENKRPSLFLPLSLQKTLSFLSRARARSSYGCYT